MAQSTCTQSGLAMPARAGANRALAAAELEMNWSYLLGS